MIFLAVAGQKLAIEAGADFGKMGLKPRDCRVVKNLAPVFADENKVTDQF